MRRCSSLWGIQPSLAATTSSATSTAPTPASMFLMKRSWPGTSTKPTSLPDGSVGEREAEVDGEPARLLLGEAVGIGAGEREDERRLAVVDVAGGGDDPHASPRVAPSGSGAERGDERGVVGRVDACAGRRRPRRRRPGRPRRARAGGASARRRRRRRRATPTDGIVSPGSDPPPATASVSTTLRAGDARRRSPRRGRAASSSGAVAMRQSGIDGRVAGEVRERDGLQRGEGELVGAHRPGQRMRARSSATRSARPTMTPACGPPSSLSPENVTSAAPASMAWRTPGLVAQPRRPVREPGRGLVEQAGAGVDHHRRPEPGELGHRRSVSVKPDHAVVRRVHLQDQRGVGARARARSRRAACGWWCRPRRAGSPTRP